MSEGGNLLTYTIYEDAARTRIWRDGTVGTVVSTMTGTGAPHTLTAFGSVADRALNRHSHGAVVF